MPRKSGKQRILGYLQMHIGQWIHNKTLREISGVNDTPRTIRALRQEGWQIEVRGDGYNRLVSQTKLKPKGLRQPISKKLRYEILLRDGNRCRSCGRGPENGVNLVIDHVVPVDWGGATERNNLQTLCEECNSGKQAWVSEKSIEVLREILSKATVEQRIEALFEAFPNQDVPSAFIQLVARAFDWQRALRRIRERTGKRIIPTQSRRAYRYYKS